MVDNIHCSLLSLTIKLSTIMSSHIINLMPYNLFILSQANILNFTTKWNGNMTCGVNRNFIVDDRTLDGACDVPIRVHSVRIEGSVVGSLCEFQVSGGKNHCYQLVAVLEFVWSIFFFLFFCSLFIKLN